jgi:hypothetical protein
MNLNTYFSPRAASGTSVPLRHEGHEGHEERQGQRDSCPLTMEMAPVEYAHLIKYIAYTLLQSFLPSFVTFVTFVPSW